MFSCPSFSFPMSQAPTSPSPEKVAPNTAVSDIKTPADDSIGAANFDIDEGINLSAGL